MRGWTLGVSIVVHLCIIGGAIVAPLFATGELPVPPRATEYVLVSAHMPETPKPRSVTAPETVSNAAPFVAPDVVAPEPVEPQPQNDAIDLSLGGISDASGTGLAPGIPTGTVVENDLIAPVPLRPKTPVPVGGIVSAPQRIRDVAPRYPSIALASRVEGVVILQAVIAEDGSVRDVRVLRSKPLLDEAAMDAVRQWRFTPTRLNGEPVPVVMTVTVSFSLK
jgi:protein TonB